MARFWQISFHEGFYNPVFFHIFSIYQRNLEQTQWCLDTFKQHLPWCNCVAGLSLEDLEISSVAEQLLFYHLLQLL